LRKLLIALAATAFATGAMAADLSCADRAAEKKLAGAAKKRFMIKCEKDTKAAAASAAKDPAVANCEAKAADKKLAGAAKTSFVKKCAADANAGVLTPTPTKK